MRRGRASTEQRAQRGLERGLAANRLARRRDEPTVGERLVHVAVETSVVSETDYISTMPRRLAQQLVKRYPLRILPTPLLLPRFAFSLLWHPRLDHDPAHVWLRQFIAKISRAV